MKRKPLKRHPALQGISREHHQALMLVFNLKKGLENGIALERLTHYSEWFYAHYLKQHLAEEESIIFPLFGEQHPLIKKALKEHQEIRAYYSGKLNSANELLKFAKLLEGHIRFEERELFELIQEHCKEEDIQKAGKNWEETDFCSLYPDPFWQAY